MDCPKCAGVLTPLVIDGVEVDRCPDCRGVWFDKRELNEALPRVEAAPLLAGDDPAGLDHKRARCPRDQAPLLRVHSARNRDVTLDTCSVCQGIWLDGGEFAALKAGGAGAPFFDLL